VPLFCSFFSDYFTAAKAEGVSPPPYRVVFDLLIQQICGGRDSELWSGGLIDTSNLLRRPFKGIALTLTLTV